MEIEVGKWIMKEGLLLGRFSHPFRVTAVKGQRVYYERLRRNQKGEIDQTEPGYCLKKSVRYVVETEEAGIQFWEQVYKIRNAENEAIAATQKLYNGYVTEAAAVVPGLKPYKG